MAIFKRLTVAFLIGALVMLALTAYRLTVAASFASQLGLSAPRSSAAPAAPSASASQPKGMANTLRSLKDRKPPPLPNEFEATQASAQPPALRSISVLINAGPPRSRVFVDGALVGRAPFLGQVNCRSGVDVEIEVIPDDKSAPSLKFRRRCGGEVIRIIGRDRR